MSLEDPAFRHARAVRAGSAPRKLRPALDITRADRVMTIAEWAELCGFSKATGLRVIKTGQGPHVVQLSERRIGVRVSDHAAWLESRRVPRTAEVA